MTLRPAARSGAPALRIPKGTHVLVWIDSREALIVQGSADAVDVRRMTSDVPPRHRATGHVRHDPTTRHGGGRQDDDESRRLEHLSAYVHRVVDALPDHANLSIVGPGEVRHVLARAVAAHDSHRHVARAVESRAAHRLTPDQLIADYRDLVGDQPRRLRSPAGVGSGGSRRRLSPHGIPRLRTDRQEIAARNETVADLKELAEVADGTGAMAQSSRDLQQVNTGNAASTIRP